MKLVLLLSFLISLAVLSRPTPIKLLVYLLLLVLISLAARLPVLRLLRASLFVIPFVGFFALVVYLAGDSGRAWLILSKTYLSALTVLVTLSCSTLPELLAAAHFFRFPSLLAEVTQLIYRYLFVLASEARVMQTAFTARGGRSGRLALRASSGIVAVLFSRSYQKASSILHAMDARGYASTLYRPQFAPITAREMFVLTIGLTLMFALHWF